MDHIVNLVRIRTVTPQVKLFESLQARYPERWMWLEVLHALPGAKVPNIAFVHAVLRDRRAQGDKENSRQVFNQLLCEEIRARYRGVDAVHRATWRWEKWRADPHRRVHSCQLPPARGHVRSERVHSLPQGP